MSTSARDETSTDVASDEHDEMRLYNVVQAELRLNFIKHDFDARQLRLRPGEQVIVETERGPTIAEVTGHVQRKLLPDDDLPRVLRRANEADIRRAEKNDKRQRRAYRFCLERIRARGLPMKLVRTHYMHDGSKIVFYFTADGRIDFRELVKDLAHEFRTRIEMRQIGVRDGARMLGGIGPCGRELCCSTFLEEFTAVSIRMAKQQGLTLNPSKVSGMCGRLMCCLVYEQKMYRRIKKSLPRAGQTARTARGVGEIVELDVVNRRVDVRLGDDEQETFCVDQIEVVDADRLDETVDRPAARPDEKSLWDDGEAGTVDFVGLPLAADGGSRRRRRARTQESQEER